MGIDSNGFTDTDIKNIVNNDTCAIMASIKIAFQLKENQNGIKKEDNPGGWCDY